MMRAKNLLQEVDIRSETGTEEMLSVSHITGITPRREKKVTMFEAESTEGYKICEIGQIAANTMWTWQGAIGVSSFYGIVSPAYNVYKQRGSSYDYRYLDILLREKHLVNEYRCNSTGLRPSRLRLYADKFLCISLPLPPPDEQTQIVRYLDAMTAKINKLIRAKKKQIALLHEQKQAIINQAVTKGLDPNVEMKDSGIRFGTHIPTHWTAIPAKYVVNITNGSDPQNTGEIPVYGSGASSFKTCGEFKEGPAVLLGRKGATLNIPHYITGKYWNVDTAFDAKTKNCSYDLRFYFYCATCFDYFFYMSQTTLPSMTQSDYGNMRLPYPPNNEQTDIFEHLDKHCRGIDTLIAQCKKEIALAVEYKNSLISAVVTGKMDIRGLTVEDVLPEDVTIDDEEAGEDVEEETTEAESED